MEIKGDFFYQQSSRWLLANLTYFDCHVQRNDETIKAFVELLYMYLSVPIEQLDVADEQILLFIHEVLAKEDFTAHLIHDLDAVQGVSIIGAFKQKFNLSNNSNHRFWIDSNIIHQIEKIPYRRMDIKASYEWLGLDSGHETYEQLLNQTILMQETPLYALSYMEMYSITHVIFYLTKLGEITLAERGLSSDRIQMIEEKLTKLVYITFWDGHYDLLLEVLLCFEMMGSDLNERLLTEIWKCLAQKFKEKQLIFPINNYVTEQDTDKELFIKCYHTTLVMFFLTKRIVQKSKRF